MIAARITLSQAVITLTIAASGLFVSFYISKYGKKSRYPIRPAIATILITSLWLVINVIDDRTTSRFINILFSQIAYFIPLIWLLSFQRFVLAFPPVSSTRLKKTLALVSSLLIVLDSAIVFHPSGLVEHFDFTTQKLTITQGPYYYFVILSFLALLAPIGWTTFKKKQFLADTDKPAFNLIVVSFLVTALIGIALEILIVLTPLTVSQFIYAYFATLIFMVAFGYAIIRYGALGAGITISRNLLFLGTTTTVVLIVSYLFLSLRDKLSLGRGLTSQVSLIVIVGLAGYFIIESLLDRYIKKHNAPIPLKPFTSNSDFLGDIKNRYHLSWSIWQEPQKAKTTHQATHSPDLTSPLSTKTYRVTRPGSTQRALGLKKRAKEILHRIYLGKPDKTERPRQLALNAIDTGKRDIVKLGARGFSEAGPGRISIIINTKKGTYIAGHKKYNLAFNEAELRLLRHEVNLHSARLEIRDIKAARAGHVHQLEELSNNKKEKLERANNRLRQNLQRRAEFFQNIAAELRTPLTIIQAALIENPMALEATQLATLKDNNKRLLNLTKELDLAGGNRSTVVENLKALRVNEIGPRYQNSYRAALARKNIKLLFFVFPYEAKISLNPVHFEQIMDNLISNAIKYSPKNTTISVYLKTYPGRFLVQVADQGPGIKKNEQRLVFEPFFRAASAKDIKGTGLGLSAVKRIATLYQGQARAKNNPEGGSIFEVDLNVRTEINPAPDVEINPAANVASTSNIAATAGSARNPSVRFTSPKDGRHQ